MRHSGPTVKFILLILAAVLTWAAGAGPALGRELRYHEYIASFGDASRPELAIYVPAAEYTSGAGLSLANEGHIFMDEAGYIEWEVDVPAKGLYNIMLSYYPAPGAVGASSGKCWLMGNARLPKQVTSCFTGCFEMPAQLSKTAWAMRSGLRKSSIPCGSRYR